MFCCKELHNKDLQTLKKSHAEQTQVAENVIQNLVRGLASVLFNMYDPYQCCICSVSVIIPNQ